MGPPISTSAPDFVTDPGMIFAAGNFPVIRHSPSFLPLFAWVRGKKKPRTDNKLSIRDSLFYPQDRPRRPCPRGLLPYPGRSSDSRFILPAASSHPKIRTVTCCCGFRPRLQRRDRPCFSQEFPIKLSRAPELFRCYNSGISLRSQAILYALFRGGPPGLANWHEFQFFPVNQSWQWLLLAGFNPHVRLRWHESKSDSHAAGTTSAAKVTPTRLFPCDHSAPLVVLIL
jgi:hypothetical protein